MSAYIKYPEEIQKCIDIYDPYGSQIANGELDKLPQEVIHITKQKNGFGNKVNN